MTKIVVNNTGKPEQLIPAPSAPTPNSVARNSMDVDTGYMVEGRYAWNPFCTYHGEQQDRLYPGIKRRTISVWEYLHAGATYRCYACSRPLMEDTK